MTFYILVMVLQMNRGGAMTSVPDFTDIVACEKAGRAWQEQAGVPDALFYCVPYTGRGE